MEEKDGAFVLGWRGEEHGVIAVGMETANDLGSWRFVDAQPLAAESGKDSALVDAPMGVKRRFG